MTRRKRLPHDAPVGWHVVRRIGLSPIMQRSLRNAVENEALPARHRLLEIAQQTVREATAYQPMPEVECLTCAARQGDVPAESEDAAHSLLVAD